MVTALSEYMHYASVYTVYDVWGYWLKYLIETEAYCLGEPPRCPTHYVYPLFLQFGLNDLLRASGGGLSGEADEDRKVSGLFLHTVEEATSHHGLKQRDTQTFFNNIATKLLLILVLWSTLSSILTPKD